MKNYAQTKGFHWLSFLLGIGLTSLRCYAAGGIVTDGSVGDVNAINHPQALSGSTVNIPESLGSTRGGNLFHSFKEFNIQNGQEVTFQEKKPMSTDNVITRVTGNSGSDINGTLSVTPGGRANFYLINPNGVTIGPKGQVDVPGSIHLSTADVLKFKDGHSFSAVQPAGSSLSSAAPSAFGFLGTSTTNNGLLKIDRAFLSGNQGKAFDVVAGKINYQGYINNDFTNLDEIDEVRLVAVNGPATISLVPDIHGSLPLPSEKPSDTNSGDIFFKNADMLILNEMGGRVGIWGGNTEITNSYIVVSNEKSHFRTPDKGINIISNSLKVLDSDILSNIIGGNEKAAIGAGINISTTKNLILETLQDISPFNSHSSRIYATSDNITINAGGDIILKGNGSIIITNGFFFQGKGTGGTISLVAGGNVMVVNGGSILTGNDGGKNSGNISVSAGGKITVNGRFSFIGSPSVEDGTDLYINTGNTGNVTLTTKRDLEIIDGAKIDNHAGGIIVNTQTVGFSQAGKLRLNVGQNLKVLNGGQINSESFGKGSSGNVALKVEGNVTVNNSTGHLTPTGIFAATHGEGNAGNIDILVKGNINVLNGGQIDTSTSGKGDAGNLTLTTGQNLTVDGQKNELNATFIASRATAESTGRAGTVNIKANGNITLNSATVSSDTFGLGQGGTVSVKANKINIDNATIGAASKSPNSGNPGNVQVSAKEILNLDHGIISIENNSITSRPDNPEKISNVLVSAPTINLKDSQVTTQSTGNRPAGSISVDFKNALCLDSSFLSTESQDGNGGDIAINGGELVDLKNSGFTTTVKGIKGDGGNINVTADNMVMETGLIQANTAAKSAKGGNISLNLKALIPSGSQLTVGGLDPIRWKPGLFGFNVIQAAAPSGLSGSIRSTAPALNLSGTLANLGSPQFDTAAIDQNYCSLGAGSSLTRLGKGGLKPKGRDDWVY